MADRRRINGPVGVTCAPIFVHDGDQKDHISQRSGARDDLKTGVTASASGSAYLEIGTSCESQPSASGLKLACTVHGPRSLPRSSPFSPHMIMSTYVKYAPFATRQRRGYLRDPTERDLATHLETALRGAVIADRWPKSGVDIVVSILEGDQDRRDGHETAWDTMNALSGCITVAAAALADAGIDCVDTVAGGVAALVAGNDSDDGGGNGPIVVIDPVPSEHDTVLAACCVAYLPAREEVTSLWFKGDVPASEVGVYDRLVEGAVRASRSANRVLVECLREAMAA